MLKACLPSLSEGPELLAAEDNARWKDLVGPKDYKDRVLIQLWAALLPTRRGGHPKALSTSVLSVFCQLLELRNLPNRFCSSVACTLMSHSQSTC